MATLLDTLIQRGLQQGLQQAAEQTRAEVIEGIKLALELKFGAEGLALMPEVAAIGDLATLRAVRDAIRPARTVDDVRAVYRRAAA